MSVLTITNPQNRFQYTRLAEAKKNHLYPHKQNLQMAFLLDLITDGVKLKKRHDEDNFPKDRYWQCKRCDYMNLVSVWKCDICGTARQ